MRDGDIKVEHRTLVRRSLSRRWKERFMGVSPGKALQMKYKDQQPGGKDITRYIQLK